MFSTLESNWDQSARRGRATLVSFTIQAFTLSLLFAISILWVERPPQVHWLEPFAVPAAGAPARTPHTGHPRSAAAASEPRVITAPRSFPVHAEVISDSDAPPAPDLPTIAGSHDRSGIGVGHEIGEGIAPVIPTRPVAAKPIVVSHWAEGNLVYRVRPAYPSIARQARVQGTVELRAIISKAGTIENLIVVRGHPMLATAAIDAVKQWRYRPYLLNNEPVEVETEITVNFLLSGG
jgi:protein TonB